jgi:hypothetical protein
MNSGTPDAGTATAKVMPVPVPVISPPDDEKPLMDEE